MIAPPTLFPLKRHSYARGGSPVATTVKVAGSPCLTVRFPGCWVIEGEVEPAPQLVAMVPWLLIVPITVPQPDRVAFLEMTKPSAKTWVPPRN